MVMPSPAIASIDRLWPELRYAPLKPWLVTSTSPPMPAEAEAPPDLLTPLTARPASSAALAQPLQFGDRRQLRIEQIEIRKRVRQRIRIREPGIGIVGRDARHRHGTPGEFGGIGLDVVGGDHCLPRADEHAQADVVAFGAFGFFDRALAHLHGKRDRAHRDRVGGIGACGAGRGHQSFGQLREG